MIEYRKPTVAWQLLLGCEIGVYTLAEIRNWAARELAKGKQQGEQFLLSDLMAIDDLAIIRHGHPNPLQQLVVTWNPEHDCHGPEATEFAKQIWFDALDQYVHGAGDPDDISILVDWIEVRFDHPAWLGGMYDACDMAPNDRALSPQIEAEARTILKAYRTAN